MWELWAKKITVRNVESQHPPTFGQRAALKRRSCQQCMGLTCQESHCVENAVERKLRKGANQTEKKRTKGFLTSASVLVKNLRIKIEPPCSINFLSGSSGNRLFEEFGYKNSPSCRTCTRLLSPRFLITLFFSLNGACRALANIVFQRFKTHHLNLMLAASPGDEFSVSS